MAIMTADQKTLEQRLEHFATNISFGRSDDLDNFMNRLSEHTKGIMRVEFVKDYTLGSCRIILRTPKETAELYANGLIKLTNNANTSIIWLPDNDNSLFFFIEDLAGKPMSELSFGHITLESELL